MSNKVYIVTRRDRSTIYFQSVNPKGEPTEKGEVLTLDLKGFQHRFLRKGYLIGFNGKIAANNLIYTTKKGVTEEIKPEGLPTGSKTKAPGRTPVGSIIRKFY